MDIRFSGDRWSSTQHPLYFLGTHSRVSFCAVEMSAGVFAEFERSITKERILASHEREKAEGKSIGRPSVKNDSLKTSIQFMREQGIGIKKIAAELNVSVGTVYSALKG